MMMKDDSSESSEEDPERARRGTHGGVCTSLYANRACKEFTISTGGTRQRRKGHGGSAVCMAIVATQKQQLTAAILFSEDTVATFNIAYAEEDAELAIRCDEDFETLLGAHTAATAMMMKDDSESSEDPERARRGKHGGACTLLYANRACKEFVGGTRQRRKGHGASAVCQAIINSVKTTTTTTVVANRCSVFGTRKECNVAKASADVLGFLCVFRSGSANSAENGCLEKEVSIPTTTTTADSNRCAAFSSRKQCNAAKADADALGFTCIFRSGSSVESENGCLEKQVATPAPSDNRCEQFTSRKKCKAAKEDAVNLGFTCVFRKNSGGCVEK